MVFSSLDEFGAFASARGDAKPIAAPDGDPAGRTMAEPGRRSEDQGRGAPGGFGNPVLGIFKTGSVARNLLAVITPLGWESGSILVGTLTPPSAN